MSYLATDPELLASAASDLASIGSALDAANAAASAPISEVRGAGADEVSAAVTSLLTGHAQSYSSLSAQAIEFHAQFSQTLTGGANKYATAESAVASLLGHPQTP